MKKRSIRADGNLRRGIKSVETAGRILDLLARSGRPVAVHELATAGHMSAGKAHRYLVSFLASGLARQDPDTRRYALGPLAMRLGLAALSTHQPLRDAIAFQSDLRNRIDETLVLSVWSAQGPTVVHVDESSQPIIMTMRVGATLPILASATGLVFAAFLPRHFTEPAIAAALRSNTGFDMFARDRETVDRIVDDVRRQGYAYNEGHLMQGISAAAFPLFDRSSTLIAVTAVMARTERLSGRDGADIIARVKAAAEFYSPR